MNLKIDFASHEAASYACRNWHYSKCMPAGANVKFGVWEDDKFIGCVIFALGANRNISRLHGKTAELSRVALTTHQSTVTRIISICLKKLKDFCPKLKSVISYADLDRHEGIIYKAGNWLEEETTYRPWIKIHGKDVHQRSAFAKYTTGSVEWLKKNVDPNAHYIQNKGKKRFVWFYDKKKRALSKDSVVSGFQSEEGGANPTNAPQKQVKNA